MRHCLWNISLTVGLLSSVGPLKGADLNPVGMSPTSYAPNTSGSPAPGGAPQESSGQAVWQDQADALKEVGVTTLNESQGNWFFKNKIAKDSRKLNDKISKKVTAIVPLQEKFLTERGVVDVALSAFYREYGVKAGEVDGRLNLVLEDLKKLEETISPLDDQEKLLLVEAIKKKEEIAALQNDFEVLQKLEDALSKSLVTMSAQVTKAHAYSDQAWDFYEKIEDTLSDEAAEELLNKTHVLFDNITAIEAYLTGEFRAFFTATSQKITEKIASIQQRINALKDQGIILGQKMRDLERDEAALQREHDLHACARNNKENELKNRTWLSPIFDGISWVWVTIRNSVVYVYESITGLFISKKAPKKPEAVPAGLVEPTVSLPASAELPIPLPVASSPTVDIQTAPVAPLPLEASIEPPVTAPLPLASTVLPAQKISNIPSGVVGSPEPSTKISRPLEPLVSSAETHEASMVPASAQAAMSAPELPEIPLNPMPEF